MSQNIEWRRWGGNGVVQKTCGSTVSQGNFIFKGVFLGDSVSTVLQLSVDMWVDKEDADESVLNFTNYMTPLSDYALTL